ncbi:MAG: glycosyltransferase family 4 protein [Planctomycetota bacterium]
MRILYHHRTRGDGAEGIHIGEMITAFESIGHRVKLVCPWTGKRNLGLDRHQATVTTSGTQRGWKLWLKQVVEILYNCVSFIRVGLATIVFRPNFIYERYSAYHVGGVFASRLLGTPLVLEVNATFTGRFGSRFPVCFPRLLKFFESFALRKSTLVIVVSEALKECVTEQGVDPNRVLVLPNAVNENKCAIARQRLPEVTGILREKLSLRSDFVIGFVGSLRKWHGIDFLIESIPPILSKCPNCQFLIVGSGEMETNLKAFVEKESLSTRVLLNPGVEHDLVFDYLGLMTVGLMPDSNQFGSPMKIIEYMAMGVIPVAPDLEPIREIVEDRKTGMVFRQRDHHAFVDAIATLYGDEKLRLQLSKSAQEYVLSHCTWRINAEKTVSAIERLNANHH